MPLLGNLYKELILEPVKTWQPKAGGALHKVARGAAAIPRDQTGTELGSNSWFSTAHIWGCLLVATFGLVDIFCAVLRLISQGTFHREFFLLFVFPAVIHTTLFRDGLAVQSFLWVLQGNGESVYFLNIGVQALLVVL